MADGLSDLRMYLFDQRTDELHRFRQVVANTVLATDIFDKELNDLRKKRWTNAFSHDHLTTSTSNNFNDHRATIVIEHLIQGKVFLFSSNCVADPSCSLMVYHTTHTQHTLFFTPQKASDVSHTMQHWRVYRKWNERLFEEMYMAFRANRMGADPTTFWYQGELGFFDNYIIPLANKLKECNVFGVSSGTFTFVALCCCFSSSSLLTPARSMNILFFCCFSCEYTHHHTQTSV
jgi:3'5'-cyclic nucleotide phosphodiesterase